jgi:uncharacterized membrane protein YagU involved in acid resistance
MDIRRIFISGVIASLVLAMWEMVVEAVIPDGAGFFGPPIAIGAAIVRDLQGSANPLPFNGLALILGLMGHMMNSVVLAAVFGAFVTRTSLSSAATIGLGAAWGVLVFAAMWLVALPIIDPVMLNLNGLVFLAAHMMWGGALGLIWVRFGQERTPALAR